jgi:GNAT superfamily N-acetyltransferase
MISYSSDKLISNLEFIDVLERSTLAERRPVSDPERIQAMLDNANVLITAWDGDKLIGISRAISDRVYCTYLSDLAVDVAYQKSGIGKKLIEITHEVAGLETNLILLAAPAAVNYYPKIGMEQFSNCFLFRSKG